VNGPEALSGRASARPQSERSAWSAQKDIEQAFFLAGIDRHIQEDQRHPCRNWGAGILSPPSSQARIPRQYILARSLPFYKTKKGGAMMNVHALHDFAKMLKKRGAGELVALLGVCLFALVWGIFFVGMIAER
jgi:hypothetical protein